MLCAKTPFAMPETALPLDFDTVYADALSLLEGMIAIPSFSREESPVADFLAGRLAALGLTAQREGCNLWCKGTLWLPSRPTLLLNAHIDTVRPAAGWTRDPFAAQREGDRLYGLGSNDCGGGLVALLAAFRLLQGDARCGYNLVWCASAEEEVSGREGIARALPLLPPIDCAIVGEPTGLQPAIAEKGLMVLDCEAHGRAGHAARNEGINALYLALDDIAALRTKRFARVSPLLGAVKLSVTMIEAGTQHNVVPSSCRFVVDVRSNECYSNEELLKEIRETLVSTVTPRSTRLNSSHCPAEHDLVRRATACGLSPFGSPTLSDQALMSFPSLKLGPGESARSHTADEFICLSEIRRAIACYVSLLRDQAVSTPGLPIA